MNLVVNRPRSGCRISSLLSLLAAGFLITGCGPSSNFNATLAKAKGGDFQAQIDLGQMYLEGRDVKQNATEGVNWIKQAAFKGFAPAQRTYGMILRAAPPGTGNAGQGIEWLEKAARQNDIPAQIELAGIHGLFTPPFDFVESMKWVLIAEKNGATNAESIKKMIEPQMSASDLAKARARAAEFVVEK